MNINYEFETIAAVATPLGTGGVVVIPLIIEHAVNAEPQLRLLVRSGISLNRRADQNGIEQIAVPQRGVTPRQIFTIQKDSSPGILPSIVGTEENQIIEIIGIGQICSGTLLQVADAGSGLRLFPRLIQRRQQHGSQNRYDRNYYEKFDKGERVPSLSDPGPYHVWNKIFHDRSFLRFLCKKGHETAIRRLEAAGTTPTDGSVR